ncbi:MAG: L-threonylcarbamoyladenylate synthase [Haloquadratum sp.]|jgi:translation factor SUA5|nr:L-threonylcarbamoyladenylate synthase [Haloferacaceae archaeon]MDR9444664.1 L-threonylcarbamoyladenylate synthase [Haloquadratum sp.]
MTDPQAIDLTPAIEAIRAGTVVIYPTETVYGLGADATRTAAVEAVYAAKARERSKPMSIAIASLATVYRYSTPTDLAHRFMRAFLPGPVTVIAPRRTDVIVDAVTAGEPTVGIRLPAHPVAQRLLEAVDPIPLTATSANRSGAPPVTTPATLDPSVVDAVAATIDVGALEGTAPSTVVDPAANVIHRAGPLVRAVEAWLTDAHGRKPAYEG